MHLTGEELFESVFYSYARERAAAVEARNGRFVHHTSAEAAMNILRTRRIWMRKATAMNDSAEIEYGLSCLRTAFQAPTGGQFWRLAESISPGIADCCGEVLNGHVPAFRLATFLACVSEHDDDEDDLGRLSM